VALPTPSGWQQWLDVAKLAAAAGVFAWGVYEWRRAQAWKRAELLDKLIREFETTPALRLAAQALDWTSRSVTLPEIGRIGFTNEEFLAALRRHREAPDERFSTAEATLRDAFDALLAFFSRLEVAVADGLVHGESTIGYFGYWIERYATLDRHSGHVPQAVEYAVAYSDVSQVHALFRRHPRWEAIGKRFDEELRRQRA
jgi:hypothetical protein